MSNGSLRITVWNENIHDRDNPRVKELYPAGIHGAVAAFLQTLLGADTQIRTATLEQQDHGLSDEVLESTDVLTWWGHVGHDQVSEAVASKVQARVLAGMGLVVMHSAHYSKPFRKLMGSSCSLRWREADDRELVWTVNPGHPIAQGIPHPIVVPKQEMYGEYFDIPQPDELVFVSTFSGGEVFRSGCCFTRGQGRIFYFSPGHESYPVYHQDAIQRVLANAVRWVAPQGHAAYDTREAIQSPTNWFENPQ